MPLEARRTMGALIPGADRAAFRDCAALYRVPDSTISSRK
ncbi:hypothetical protein DBB_8410 [Desulfoluna spongiiphila]|nr:hypothetical protein DBB_8410 [Desulfoluna spongiiphila]